MKLFSYRMSWLWAFGDAPEFAASDVWRYLQSQAQGEKLPDDHPMARFNDVTLIDVRTAGEFEAGHIPGARINESVLPPWSLRSRLEALKLVNAPDHLILCICLSAHRSVMAVKLLRDAGFDQAFQLAGGMQAWRELKLPEESSPKEHM
jgi:rhodanese-related sulfurtransferase